MKNSGTIEHAMVSFSISAHNQQSAPYALFGQNNYSQIVGGKDGLFTYESVMNPLRTWAMDAKNLYYGTKPLAEDKSYPGIIDTGSSQISVPPALFEKLKAEWTRVLPNIDCNHMACTFQGKCSEVAKKTRPIGFLMNDRVFSIASDTFLF